MKIDGKPMQDQWVLLMNGAGRWRVLEGFPGRAEAVAEAKRYNERDSRMAVAKIVPSCYIEDGKVRPCD